MNFYLNNLDSKLDESVENFKDKLKSIVMRNLKTEDWVSN